MSITTVQNPNSGIPSPVVGRDAAVGELTTGAVYSGVIDVVDPRKNTYTVKVDRPAATIPDCVYGPGVFSGLLGIRLHLVPMPGTRVAVVYDNPSYIVGTLPSEPPDLAAGGTRTLTHGVETPDVKLPPTEDDSGHVGAAPGQDFFPGELEIGNQIGVALQFLTTLVKLQAGDRAKVECHLMDDMVRIVSDQYRHYTSFGDFTVENGGGGATVIWHGTNKTHDAWGQVGPQDTKAKVSKRQVEKDGVAETGRWRFSQYMGYLGDFIHLMITDPEGAIGQLAQNRAGKFDCHVNTDGGLIVRSVAEISFERVTRIAVPIQNKHADDPSGETRETIEKAVASGGLNLDNLLKRWDYGTKFDRIHFLPYQLREYARYLNQYHAWARVLSQSSDFSLESEADCPSPSYNNGEVDVTRANQGQPDYYETYSCMRILRDGSQVHMDGYGNAILMSREGVSVTSYKDIILEAARDIRMVAGHNLLLHGRRNVEINALVGRLTLRARTFFQALCEWGSIHFKSDAPDPEDPQFGELKKTAADQPQPDEDPDPVIMDQAILFEGAAGSTTLRAGRRVSLESTGEYVRDSEKGDPDDTHGSIVLQSKAQDVWAYADRNAWMYALGGGSSEPRGNVGLRGTKSVTVVGGAEGIQMRAAFFDVNQLLTVRPTAVVVRNLKASLVAAENGIYGPPMGPTDITGKVGGHKNHIRKYEDAPDVITDAILAEDGEVDEIRYHTRKRFQAQKLFKTEPSWNYPPPEEYVPDPDDDLLPWKSITEERIVEDADLSDFYETWNWSGDNRLDTIHARTGDKHPNPWYGESPKWQYFQHTEPLLSQNSSTAPIAQNVPPEKTTEPRSMHFRKRKS